jgi:hypothetical protein
MRALIPFRLTASALLVAIWASDTGSAWQLRTLADFCRAALTEDTPHG